MKAVVFDCFGEPDQVLQVRDVPVPKPAPGQVRVRMLASPINPSDLLYVRGQYGRRPDLPASPGFEGVGIIEESGGGFLGWRALGKRVAVLNSAGGNWQEQVVISAIQAIPLPADIPDEQAASFFVNPASALAMIRHGLRVPRGAWLLQSAAGSALGRMVIRLGKRDGFRTINLVRRPEQVDELLREGADAAVCTADGPIADRIRQLTNGHGVPFALDAVGGDVGVQALNALAPGGRMLVYGRLSGQPIAVDPGMLIVGQKRMEGFWLSEWIRDQGLLRKLLLMRRIKKLMRAGVLTSTVGKVLPLDEVQAAVRAAAEPGRVGKVLLRISGA